MQVPGACLLPLHGSDRRRSEEFAGLHTMVSYSPLLLVVCSDTDRYARLRSVLTPTGVLVARAPTPERAVHLLSQIRVDGCLLVDPASPESAARLGSELERMRPGCIRLALPGTLDPVPPGWTTCTEGELSAVVSAWRSAIAPTEDM